MLQQDILNRAVRVQWTGGEYVLLWVEGRHPTTGVGSVPLPPVVSLTCPELGWNDRPISHSALLDKVTGFNNPASIPVPLFDVAPNLTHGYPVYEESRSRTETANIHVLDRGLYNIIDRITGAVVTDGTGPFGTVEIPFIIDYTGDTSGGGGLDVRTPDGTSTYYSQLALAKAIAVGIGGHNWDCNFVSELAGHDEITSYQNNTSIQNRLMFLNWSKIKSQLRALGKKKLDIVVRVDASIGTVGAKTSYYGFATCSIHSRSFGYKTWPTKVSADVDDFQFQQMLGWPDFVSAGRTKWPPGAPNFIPPNEEPPADSVVRLPLLSPTSGGVQYIETTETKKGPAQFTITLTMKDSNAPGDPEFDAVTFSDVEYDF